MSTPSGSAGGWDLMRLPAALERLAQGIEHAQFLDTPGEVASGVLRRVVPAGRLRNMLSGTPLGHPLHPVLVALPVGAWSAASYLDLTGGNRDAARRLVALGNLVALPTALSGAADWLSTSGAERRVGLVHSALNSVALVLYTGSWLERHRGRWTRGVLLSLAGAAVAGGAGWLGGHLVFALGVGVDTTSFQQAPEEWTDVAAESDLPERVASVVDANGVPILLVKADGRLFALADRCTHRGGPLHEGTVSGACITCPWHGSVYRITDGSVVAGPTTRPQPVAEVRVVDGRVQVRRSAEARALRSNPVGV